MTEVFNENFDDVSDWDLIDGTEATGGKLVLSSGYLTGAAIRRRTVPRSIIRTSASVSVVLPANTFLDVFLSRNGRHYMQAVEVNGLYSITSFNETDGTADFTDTTFTEDATLKTYSVRLVLRKQLITSGVGATVVGGHYVGA